MENNLKGWPSLLNNQNHDKQDSVHSCVDSHFISGLFKPLLNYKIHFSYDLQLSPASQTQHSSYALLVLLCDSIQLQKLLETPLY